MTDTKFLLNSVVSNAADGARFASMDFKDMFLNTSMDRPEYMKVQLKCFPSDIIRCYNLQDKVHLMVMCT